VDSTEPIPPLSREEQLEALAEAAGESDWEPDESREYDYPLELDFASRLSSDALYRAYIMKLEKDEKKAKQKSPPPPPKNAPVLTGPPRMKLDPKNIKSSKMVKSVIDYVRTLEQRIQSLEEFLKEEPAESIVDKTEVPQPSEHVQLDINFYNADKEFDEFGYYLAANHNTPGTYTCRTDSQNFIRVLFSWSRDLPEDHSKQLDSNPPDPKHVKIIGIGITSEPIKVFLENATGTMTSSRFPLIRFNAPFRPLIANFEILKDQLDKLEKKFRYVRYH
jgi:hypothetical protein